MGDALPSITWLFRADESVRFCTGDYASGFLSRRELWAEIVGRGHELGWHMHLLSYDTRHKAFLFDPEPAWLGAAHGALAEHFVVRATRSGWDYGSSFLFRELDRSGIELDFSALPGNRVWRRLGPGIVNIDWLRCPDGPYRPSLADYQCSAMDGLRFIEVPVAQFHDSPLSTAKRLAWRVRHGCLAMRGLRNKTRLLTERWGRLPFSNQEVQAFFFHPDGLTPIGIRHFQENVERLRSQHDVEFLTAGGIRTWLDGLGRPRTEDILPAATESL
jgi:hypothetical protein